jgi:nitronate monooxygenase
MPIRNRLTQVLGIEHPILLAPMDLVSGGRLAAAVSHAGGLGVLGGGYGDGSWIDREWARAGNAQIGCGFITWSLTKHPKLLDRVLVHQPAAVITFEWLISPDVVTPRLATPSPIPAVHPR